MLYLITGVPGSGKTLKMISDLMKRKDLQNRPLYLDGIPEVDGTIIPNLPIPEGESMETWHKWAPPGAIIVVDECQRIFRPRPSGSKVPEHVAELETHRHRGIDIFLLTQHPRLVDLNVRSLIGHHCHISKTNLGVRRMFEWERCGDPQSRTDVEGAVKSVYTLDKKAFGVYKSAEEHTKIRTKLSRTVYAFPIVLLIVIVAAWSSYNRWQRLNAEEAQTQPAPVAAQAASPAAGGMAAATAADGTHAAGQYAPEEKQTADKPHISADDFKPAIDGQPHTAPIYDTYNKAVQTMPYPAACIKNADRCTCYTDQGTKIKGFDKALCLEYVSDGLYNPYRRPTAQNQGQAAEKPESQEQKAEVLVMGGKEPVNLMYDGYAESRWSNQGAKVGL